MKRLTKALAALVVFAAACGGGDSETAGDVLAELGLSEAETVCFEDSFAAQELDMDAVLSSDPDDLTDAERQAVIDIAADCAAAAAITEAAEADQADDETDEPDPTVTESPTENNEDDNDNEDGEGDDSGDEGNAGTRTYAELTVLEQAFVDGITESGGTEAIGICILDEFDAAGLSVLDMATLDTDDPPPEVLAAIFACGDELIDGGVFDGGLGGGASGDTYGDNAELDGLWDRCAAGEASACDELYWTSPVDSAYEAYGSTCGETLPPTFGRCDAEINGSAVEGGSYGDDPALDVLYDQCAAGDLEACDTLWFDSPIGSDYESFGSTCGGLETSPQFGSCNSTDPTSYGDDDFFDELWDTCEAGDLAACDELYLFSPIDSDYEAFGNTCGGQSAEPQFGECESQLS